MPSILQSQHARAGEKSTPVGEKGPGGGDGDFCIAGMLWIAFGVAFWGYSGPQLTPSCPQSQHALGGMRTVGGRSGRDDGVGDFLVACKSLMGDGDESGETQHSVARLEKKQPLYAKVLQIVYLV